ncbi:hypothetical protein K2X85_09680 [bacterium]|jgi:hypothetical protein|nr:hypothetical protein [bacterium]
MTIEQEFPDLTQWPVLQGALAYWGQTLLILVLLGLGVASFRDIIIRFQDTLSSRGFMAAMVGLPIAILGGILGTVRSLAVGLLEIVALPLGIRRVWAIARLAIQESIRRRVLYVLLLFLVPFLFAGWYLPKAEEGQLLYLVGFTNTTIGWLLLPMVLFVVGMSIPNDLKSRTIQTVVTKPIRRIEFIVGRVLGFMIVFTIVILVMGGVSLAYIYYQVSDQVLRDQWTARVPVYAKVEDPNSSPFYFIKQGVAGLAGTNVGREWNYRSHIEGDTPDEVRWFFTFNPKQFAGVDRTKVGMTFDVFKTTKGNPTRDEDESSGVWASLDFIDLQNPQNKFDRAFRVNNNRLTEITIPTSVLSSGQVLVRAQCVTRNQYIGMAKHDLFLLAREQSFEWNFIKGLITLWLKMLFLTSVAVSASTVLNGFVTVIFTIGAYVVGLVHNFLMEVAGGKILGGGPIESLVRLVTQMNQQADIEQGFIRSVINIFDPILTRFLAAVGAVVPDLSTIETAEYVASGFDIPSWLMMRNALLVVGYVIPVIIVGYFLFRGRETAA